MEIKNSKCPLNGFKPCDDECAWYHIGDLISCCAVVNINWELLSIADALNDIKEKLNEA